MDNTQAAFVLKVHAATYGPDTVQAEVAKLVRRLIRKGHEIEGVQQCLREVADEFND